MSSLIKQQLLTISKLSYISIALFLAIAYLIALPPMFLFIVTVVAMPISLYYYNDKNNVGRFIRSLPVSKKEALHSEYITQFILASFILIIQGIVMILLRFGWTSNYVYDWRDIIFLTCLAILIIAVSIPIFHAFQSFVISTTVILILFCIGIFTSLTPLIKVLGMKDEIIFNDLDAGYVLLVEKYIPFQPYITLIIITLFVLFVSLKLSERFVLRKDLQ